MKDNKLIALGIEGTAHTLGVGIINENAEILSNEKKQIITESGGILPRVAAESHSIHLAETIKKALDTANISINHVDIISFSQGPGLGPCLKNVAAGARALSQKYEIPLLGINHCVAHIEIGKALTNAKDPVVVYASGANTQIIAMENGRYRVFGETLDTGLGNLLDTFGREIDLGFPAGPKLSEIYYQGKNYIELPYTIKGMDLIFSGLLTAAKNKIGKENNEDIVYSLMHNAFSMVTEVTERALAHTGKTEILLTGGVACSKPLQQMLKKMCEERNAKFFVSPNSVAVDNGAMIAWQGLIEFKTGRRQKLKETEVNPKHRTDQVDIIWMKNKKN